MKKILFLMAAVAMMVSCGNKQQAEGEGTKDAAEGFTFSVQNNITGTTGPNCFLPELGAPISFEVTGDGDILDVAATVKIKHSDKTEVKDARETSELWISGRDEDNKDKCKRVYQHVGILIIKKGLQSQTFFVLHSLRHFDSEECHTVLNGFRHVPG